MYPLEVDATPYPFSFVELPLVVAIPLLFPNGEFEGLNKLDCAVIEDELFGL